VDRREHVYGVPVDPLRYKPRSAARSGPRGSPRAVMSIHMQALAAMIRADVNGEAYSLPRYVLLGATEEAFQNADGSPKPAWQAAWDAVWAVGDDEDASTASRRREAVQRAVPGAAERAPADAGADVLRRDGHPDRRARHHRRREPDQRRGAAGLPDDLIAEAEQTTDNWAPDLSSAVTRALTMLNDTTSRPTLRSSRGGGTRCTSRARLLPTPARRSSTRLPWLADTEVGLELMGLSRDQIDRAMRDKRRAAGSWRAAMLRRPRSGERWRCRGLTCATA
jgi:hypothetical protein